MSSVNDATSRLQDSYDLERAHTREANERDRQEQKQTYEEELRSRGDEYNQRLLQIRDEAQQDVKKLKENLYDRYGKSRNNEALAINSEKAQLANYKETLERETDRKVNRIEKAADDRAVKAAQTQDTKIEEALEAQKRSNLHEITLLEDELQQYRNSGKDADKERALAKQSEIQEYEGKNIDERNRIIEAYERSINKLHQKQDELSAHYERQLGDATYEANDRARSQVQHQKDEFVKADHERSKQIDRIEEHFNQEIKNERARNDRTTGTLIHQSSNDKEKALQTKDESYQAYLKENKNRTDYERMNLESQVSELRTTGDATKVSPYVVNKIEKGAEMRYQQALEKSNETHQAKLQAARARDQEDRQELQTKYNESLTRQTRDVQRGQDVEKKQFLAAYDDLETLRSEEHRQLENRMTGATERTELKRALELSMEQKRRKDELEAQRDVLHGEKVRAEDELVLKNKSDTREWAARYHELRRDFDRKLGEERDGHELKLTEMRYEYDKKLRDSGRQSARALDDRVKMYEHLIKQQELAFKEKERFLTERYEEELDRMKQTNARLIQKKS